MPCAPPVDDADTARQSEGNVVTIHARMVPAHAAMKSSALRFTSDGVMPGLKSAVPMPETIGARGAIGPHVAGDYAADRQHECLGR